MNKLSTCDAVRLIQKATLLRINNEDVSSWVSFPENMDALPDDEVVLIIRREDNSHEWEYAFTVAALLAATVQDNCITAMDANNEEDTINCYHCVPVTLD